MTYQHLLDSLTALHLHPLAETNMQGVTSAMGKVVPHLGDDLSVEGVAELHRQWEELRKKGEELDLAISSHLDRQRMVDRGVAESVELVCTKAAVVAALENWRST